MTSNHYTYRAEWSPDDAEYVGLVAEFPSLSWLAPTAGEAVDGIQRVVEDILADMAETGEIPPKPLSERRYSGNLSVRMSPDLHQRLAVEATEQGVSLNQWCVQKLAAPRSAALSSAGLTEVVKSAMEHSSGVYVVLQDHLQSSVDAADKVIAETSRLLPDLIPGLPTTVRSVTVRGTALEFLEAKGGGIIGASSLKDGAPVSILVYQPKATEGDDDDSFPSDHAKGKGLVGRVKGRGAKI